MRGLVVLLLTTPLAFAVRTVRPVPDPLHIEVITAGTLFVLGTALLFYDRTRAARAQRRALRVLEESHKAEFERMREPRQHP